MCQPDSDVIPSFLKLHNCKKEQKELQTVEMPFSE
uniref:Uncharacterized protein n=1 Tax=Anguilla anguilla TaxID=7936 RepID=A0A0E9R2I5_ANGAN